MDIFRVQVRWLGFPGAPGYSNFHFAGGGGAISDAQQVVDRVRSAFLNLQGRLPGGVNLVFPGEVDRLDSDTGELLGYDEVDQPETISFSGSLAYSAPTGAVVNWLTNDVRFGRRIRGRTFIVPINGDEYDSDGTLSDLMLTSLRDFADTLTSWDFDSEFGVWSRPRGGTGGVFASATGFRVPDKAAVLRSRRD